MQLQCKGKQWQCVGIPQAKVIDRQWVAVAVSHRYAPKIVSYSIDSPTFKLIKL